MYILRLFWLLFSLRTHYKNFHHLWNRAVQNRCNTFSHILDVFLRNRKNQREMNGNRHYFLCCLLFLFVFQVWILLIHQ